MSQAALKSSLVFKISSARAWAHACVTGAFEGSADDARDGYIHLSAAGQVAATAAKHFAGRTDLVIVAFAAARLGGALLWEPARGGDLFPHLYGPLPASAALWARAMPLGPDGVPRAPEEITAC